MADLDLDAIRNRRLRYARVSTAGDPNWAIVAVATAEDVPALLAEIDRLNAVIEKAKAHALWLPASPTLDALQDVLDTNQA